MSDEARRTLARRAGDGDLNAAIDLVLTIMRGTPPIDPMSIPLETCVVNVVNNAGIALGSHAFDRPPTGEQLRARPRIGFNEVMYNGRYVAQIGKSPDPRDTLVRWLVAHTGKVISLCQDPSSLEVVEPPEHVKKLEKNIEWLYAECTKLRDKLVIAMSHLPYEKFIEMDTLFKSMSKSAEDFIRDAVAGVRSKKTAESTDQGVDPAAEKD